MVPLGALLLTGCETMDIGPADQALDFLERTGIIRDPRARDVVRVVRLAIHVVQQYQCTMEQQRVAQRKISSVRRAATKTDKRYVAVKTTSAKRKPPPTVKGNRVETVLIYDKKKDKFLDTAYDVEIPPRSSRTSNDVQIGWSSASFPDL